MEKRYYWMKMQEDFFENDTIAWLEEQKHGAEIVLVYIKLCLRSLISNGILVRRVGAKEVPYDTKKLSEITRTAPKITTAAMELLEETGLIETLPNGALRVPAVVAMIGSDASTSTGTSAAAERVRRYRERAKQEDAVTDEALQRNADVTPCNVTCNANTDIESIELKNIELEKEIEPAPEKNAKLTAEEYDALIAAMPELRGEKDKKHQYGEYKNVLLTDEEHQRLAETYPDCNERIERLSGYIASTGKVYKNHYATIRNWAKREDLFAKPTKVSETNSDSSSFSTNDFWAAAVERSYERGCEKR